MDKGKVERKGKGKGNRQQKKKDKEQDKERRKEKEGKNQNKIWEPKQDSEAITRFGSQNKNRKSKQDSGTKQNPRQTQRLPGISIEI